MDFFQFRAIKVRSVGSHPEGAAITDKGWAFSEHIALWRAAISFSRPIFPVLNFFCGSNSLWMSSTIIRSSTDPISPTDRSIRSNYFTDWKSAKADLPPSKKKLRTSSFYKYHRVALSLEIQIDLRLLRSACDTLKLSPIYYTHVYLSLYGKCLRKFRDDDFFFFPFSFSFPRKFSDHLSPNDRQKILSGGRHSLFL